MPYATVDDLTLYYEEHGLPDGPPLVLLHGFTETGASWSEQLAALGARYRLVVPDWRGRRPPAHPARPGGVVARGGPRSGQAGRGRAGPPGRPRPGRACVRWRTPSGSRCLRASHLPAGRASVAARADRPPRLR